MAQSSSYWHNMIGKDTASGFKFITFPQAWMTFRPMANETSGANHDRNFPDSFSFLECAKGLAPTVPQEGLIFHSHWFFKLYYNHLWFMLSACVCPVRVLNWTSPPKLSVDVVFWIREGNIFAHFEPIAVLADGLFIQTFCSSHRVNTEHRLQNKTKQGISI